MKLDFRKPTLDDKELIEQHYRLAGSRSCEDTFVNLYLWNGMYPTDFALYHDMMILKSAREDFSFRFPKGPRGHLREALDAMALYSAEQGRPFRMDLVTPEQFSLLEELYPGRFEIAYDRDSADYVYEREKLAELSGKKYHGKKNHVNKFERTYSDWSYEPITDENVGDCVQAAMEWRKSNGCGGDDEKEMEFCVTLNSLRLMKELGLSGGCLRVNGRVVAFTIGEPLNGDTYVVHIEKALTDFEGAYTVINQQFVQREMEGFLYVNREDDAGDEGLRLAKLSYHPVFMVEKGVVTEKSGTTE